jgi:hypothetical protein
MNTTDTAEYLCTYCADPIEGELFGGEFQSQDAREDGEGRLIHEKCVVLEIASTLTDKQLFDVNRFVAAVRIIQDIPRETFGMFDRHPLIDFSLLELKDDADRQMEMLDPDPSAFTEELVLIRKSALVQGLVVILGEIGRIKGDIMCLNSSSPLSLQVKTELLEFVKKAANGLREATHAD